MPKLICTLFVCICVFTVSAQTPVADTAIEILEVEEGYDFTSPPPPPPPPRDPSEKPLVYRAVSQSPEFPGGDSGIHAWLRANLAYPMEAVAMETEGVVFAQLIIGATGEVTQVTILRDIGHGCGEAVQQLLANMPTWQPGRLNNGEAVATYVTIPVKFELHD